jgi:hypothetical protein
MGKPDCSTAPIGLAGIDWREREERLSDDRLVFRASQYSATVCTGYALELAHIFGLSRVQLFGFRHEDNPTSRIGREAGGHDFAIIDGRFIVDPWLDDTESISEQTVFDLLAPVDAALIADLYGSSECWERNHILEQQCPAEGVL